MLSRIETRGVNVSINKISEVNNGAADAPSGFILKLWQMIDADETDEVIKWTPDGDAFVIGSDLKYLESETLPKYFRHNRFQSLVRQLNFYSFRKINRERNVWIYKHELFHRDRPEDLYLVRRRTCPGMDGRKQRFCSRRFNTSADTIASMDNSKDDDNSVETSTSEPGLPDDVISTSIDRKRFAEKQINSNQSLSIKRARDFLCEMEPEKTKEVLIVNKFLIRDGEHDEIIDHTNLTLSRLERYEQVEQSVIVSEVAMKLAQFARKARRAVSGPRTRSGIVTPPSGGSTVTVSPCSLLTYDDELGADSEDKVFLTTHDNSQPLTLLIDNDEHIVYNHQHLPMSRKFNIISPEKRTSEVYADATTSALIVDSKAAHAVAYRVLQRCPANQAAFLVSAASVASFCMSTSPEGNKQELCSKILQLISSSDQLCREFQLYRSALRPLSDQVDAVSLHSYKFTHSRNIQALGIRQTWDREASRGDALRDFKTFAVNCIASLLSRSKCDVTGLPSCSEDLALLGRTATCWQKSMGVTA